MDIYDVNNECNGSNLYGLRGTDRNGQAVGYYNVWWKKTTK